MSVTSPTREPHVQKPVLDEALTGPFGISRPRRKRLNWWSIPQHGFVVGVALVWIIPILAMVLTSLRTSSAATTTGWWKIFGDAGITFDNYTSALTSGGMLEANVNSLLVAVPASALLVVFASVIAYTFVTTEFRGKNLLFLGIVAMLVLPPQMVIAPLLQLFVSLGINGQFAAMWVFQLGFSLPLSILILRTTYSNVPKPLLEAAAMDGASFTRTFVSVATPTALPGLASVFILNLVTTWNELLAPLLFLNSQTATVTLQIAGLVNSANRDNTTMIAAQALLSIIIPMLVFLFLQRFFVRGFMSGAVK